MITVKVLVENTSVRRDLKCKHGFSLAIFDGIKNLLLDVGPDNTFIKNAMKMNVDLSAIDFVILSHSHKDHTGGLNFFCKINSKADIVLFDNPENRYYTRFLKYFNIPVGLSVNKDIQYRIREIRDSIRIDGATWFIRNTVNRYQRSSLNSSLFKKEGGKLIPDTFDHEGILVINDKGELVIFNSCSHNGIMNIIQSVKDMFPDSRIRSYVGGLHLFNPVTRKNETDENLDLLIAELMKTDITFYAGHCTGEYSFNYIFKHLGSRIKRIGTGMELTV